LKINYFDAEGNKMTYEYFHHEESSTINLLEFKGVLYLLSDQESTVLCPDTKPGKGLNPKKSDIKYFHFTSIINNDAKMRQLVPESIR
jgi:hypothetical protein